jgi:phosphopantothenoylcysteine decarboxylase / phosphopantothenate---cysteine ligase
VESAEDMYEAVLSRYAEVDVVIKSAAVADYRPRTYHDQKIKKQPGEQVIELERTKDILLQLGEKKDHQLLIGFAAETDHVDEYARKKLISKNADMIVANNVQEAGAGFGIDTNIVTFYKKDGEMKKWPILTKKEVAQKIIDEVQKMLKEQS